jgi:hypothetical protein
MTRLAVAIIAGLLLASPAYASGYHDDECREIRECVKARPCIESDWRWYAARNRSCEPADESTLRAFLCYLDGLGLQQRFKLFRWTPLAEAAYEAQLRNQAQCSR